MCDSAHDDAPDMRYLVGIIASIVGLAAFGVWIIAGRPLPVIPPARTPAPAGFDAADYPRLIDLVSTERARVLVLNRFGEPFEHYFVPDLRVTYFMLFAQDGQRRTLFFDARGNLIGDVTHAHEVFPMPPYMVGPETYFEFSSDGVSGIQPLVDVAPPADRAELDRMLDAATLYRSFPPYDLPVDHPARLADQTVHVFLDQGVWNRAVTPDFGYREWKSVEFHQLDVFSEITRPSGDGPEREFFGRYRVELTHFDQKTYVPARGQMMGSPTGQSILEHWIGTGYYTVLIDNAPALRFRIENDREYLSYIKGARTFVYGGRGLDFIVIEPLPLGSEKTNVVVSSAELR